MLAQRMFYSSCLFYLGGIDGVFDVDEIVKVLEEENGRNIVVLPVPPEINYTDNLVLVTGMSHRHLLGMAELIRWIVSYILFL